MRSRPISTTSAWPSTARNGVHPNTRVKQRDQDRCPAAADVKRVQRAQPSSRGALSASPLTCMRRIGSHRPSNTTARSLISFALSWPPARGGGSELYLSSCGWSPNFWRTGPDAGGITVRSATTTAEASRVGARAGGNLRGGRGCRRPARNTDGSMIRPGSKWFSLQLNLGIDVVRPLPLGNDERLLVGECVEDGLVLRRRRLPLIRACSWGLWFHLKSPTTAKRGKRNGTTNNDGQTSRKRNLNQNPNKANPASWRGGQPIPDCPTSPLIQDSSSGRYQTVFVLCFAGSPISQPSISHHINSVSS